MEEDFGGSSFLARRYLEPGLNPAPDHFDNGHGSRTASKFEDARGEPNLVRQSDHEETDVHYEQWHMTPGTLRAVDLLSRQSQDSRVTRPRSISDAALNSNTQWRFDSTIWRNSGASLGPSEARRRQGWRYSRAHSLDRRPSVLQYLSSNGTSVVSGTSSYTPSQASHPENSIEDEPDLHIQYSNGSTSRNPIIPHSPTLDWFRAHVVAENPRIEDALLKKVTDEQLKRYRRLINKRQAHSRSVKLPRHNPQVLYGEVKNYRVVVDGFSGTMDADGSKLATFSPGVPVPPVSRLPAEFLCPWCLETKNIRIPSAWTKHILEDAEAYMCTFCDCSRVFKRKADWVRHENEIHRKLEWWTCNLPNCHQHTTDREENFIQHMRRKHDVREIVKGAKYDFRCHHRTTRKAIEEPCRFCGETFGDWTQLTDHLAEHLQRISLSVMPFINRPSSTATGHQHVSANPVLRVLETERHEQVPRPTIATTQSYDLRDRNVVESDQQSLMQVMSAPINHFQENEYLVDQQSSNFPSFAQGQHLRSLYNVFHSSYHTTPNMDPSPYGSYFDTVVSSQFNRQDDHLSARYQQSMDFQAFPDMDQEFFDMELDQIRSD